MLPEYAELHCVSNFSFLRGASHPEELVARAYACGYQALAITDECSVAGVVRAYAAIKDMCAENPQLKEKLKLVIGTEIKLSCGLKLVFLAKSRAGYGNMCALITLGRMRADKGSYELSRRDLTGLPPVDPVPDCFVLWVPDPHVERRVLEEQGAWVEKVFSSRAWIAAELLCESHDEEWVADLRRLSAQTRLPIVASGDVHMHQRSRRRMQDVLTALRLKTTVFAAGDALFPNAERHLRTRLRLSRLYPREWLEESVKIASQCSFCLSELKYEYPDEIVPHGHTPASYLRQEVEIGLKKRYPNGIPDKVLAGVEEELALIADCKYEAFFLTVYDVVQYARSKKILCQGRGSAANSTVCYALGITEVDPTQASLLFSRFLSKDRGEPPDIDVDFEHERREEVIQYIYEKYGRSRAALAATVIRYRTRSALRDAGAALGFGPAEVAALTRTLAWWDNPKTLSERFKQVGLNPDSPRVKKWLELAAELKIFPRHLSQHVGGFVIAQGPLAHLVPIENAAMEDRSVIQWEKDDLESLGLLKVDVLALGMLTVIRKALEYVSKRRSRVFEHADIPKNDAATYEMISKADTIGVFQIESRAQMSMLPRLRPKTFYDLVVQVAIVRPGPIQGDMVHPYLRRREGKEPVHAMKPDIAEVLGRTFGVPIFQEQVMQLAIVAADFTAEEADKLRRAMASWKQKGHVEKFKEKLRVGMARKGYEPAFAEALCRQIEGFGEYGFPESHAASFAILAYSSSWLKRHEPEAFLCALLNSQPMGFYPPPQLVQDARSHNVVVLDLDVTVSEWDCVLESTGAERPAVRLGLREIKGFSKEVAQRIQTAREAGSFTCVEDLAVRAQLDAGDLRRLASANALQALSGHRRQAAWKVTGLQLQGDLFDTAPPREAEIDIAPPAEAENIVADYQTMGLSLRRHPLALMRHRLNKRRVQTTQSLRENPRIMAAWCAGIVTCRQKPGSAKSVFVTIEDETGLLNVIVHPWLQEKQRKELLGGRLLAAYGEMQREGEVVHLIAKRLVDLSPWLGQLVTVSREFH